MTLSPAIGTFIRPAGRSGFCFEVTGICPPSEEDPREVLTLKRWGLEGGRPIDDGHVYGGFGLSDLQMLRPGVWKDEWKGGAPQWGSHRTYWLQMSVEPSGQLQLF